MQRHDSELGLTTYTYDANGRLLSESLDGAVTRYTYDSNGNTLSRDNGTEQVVYTWDYENRLTQAQVSTAAGTVESQYQYNADGVRVASIVNGVETHYLIDANRPYAQVLKEYAPDGTVQTAYVYGHDLISQTRDGQESFYHSDGLGSTQILTDAGGSITDAYTYEAFGELLSSMGTTENNYLFAGEQYDPNLESYYLRARYYDPSTGRFTARDPFEGVLTEPLSLAKYPYAHGNPVNWTDPSGLFISPSGVSASLTMASVLATIQVSYSLSNTTVAPEFSQEVIDANKGVANLVRTPISIRDTYRRVVAEREMEQAALWDYEPYLPGFPYVVWGTEYEDVFQHDYDALHGNGDTKNPPGKSPAFLAYIKPSWGRGWLDNVLSSNSSLGDRDEYPYASVAQGGEINYDLNTVSVRYVNASRNRKQGNRLGRVFYPSALTANHPLRSWFGVLALPTQHNSYWVDRNGDSHPFKPV